MIPKINMLRSIVGYFILVSLFSIQIVHGQSIDSSEEDKVDSNQGYAVTIISQMDEVFKTSNPSVVAIDSERGSNPIKRELHILKRPGICQVRLDFLSTQIAQAESTGGETGNCIKEAIEISRTLTLPQGITVCGNITGQHMYLSFRDNRSPIHMAITTYITSVFVISLTDISCDSEDDVWSSTCLQRHITRNGVITSFNNFVGPSLAYTGRQLNNQEYDICIRETPGTSKVVYAACPGSRTFFLSGTTSPYIAINNCTDNNDYITIDESKYCGNAFTILTQRRTSEVSVIGVKFNAIERNPTIPIPVLNYGSSVCTYLQNANNGLSRCFQSSSYVCTCEISFGSITMSNNTLATGSTANFKEKCEALTQTQGYEKCQWLEISAQRPEPTCVCPKIVTYDVDNTGFCLTYSQS